MPIPVDVATSPLDIVALTVSALASIAALVGVAVAIADARRARRESGEAKLALQKEQDERAAERKTADASELAQLQAVHFDVTGSWQLGPYENGKGMFGIVIRNISPEWLTDIDVFVLPPITLRPGVEDSLQARSVFHAPVLLNGGRSSGDASFPDAVIDREHSRDSALPPLIEATFTDYLGNRWFRDTDGRLTLTRKAEGPYQYDPSLYMDPAWRSTPPPT